ncbi:unnamed protein product [Phytophthora lilii]|uniref:Unnamed protein product n=1 Tax=Phytophthora lilii TaxID=2077276 RepID=A0A9W6TKP2_9STRA|nr:unnamed protein product [Phytophthora lilii]
MGTRHPTRNPTRAHSWLSWFNGKEVMVPNNGQCGILAFHATITNHSGRRFKLSKETAKAANLLKRAVYALMIANLEVDSKIRVADPSQELRILHPSGPVPDSLESTLAQLCAYLIQERSTPVTAKVSRSRWASPYELRAYAQYLRRSIVVIDISAHDDHHLQIYSYRKHYQYQPEDGSMIEHETGCYRVITEEEATLYLRVCQRLHVLPCFMVRKLAEHHFYGVHHGDLFQRWQAEGDPTSAKEMAKHHDWAEQYTSPPAGTRVIIDVEAPATSIGFIVEVNGRTLDLLETQSPSIQFCIDASLCVSVWTSCT